MDNGLYERREMDPEGIIRKARVRDQPKGTKAIVLGMGWGGATQGLKEAGISSVIEVDCEGRIETGPTEGALAPDVMALFSDGGEDLIRYAARKGRCRIQDIVLVQASPSCLATSVANGLGKSRGCGRGAYGGKGDEVDDTNEFMTVVRALLKWEEEAKQAGRQVAWLLEQPRDSSMHLLPEVDRRIGQGQTMMGCAYGLRHQKPYRMWSNIEWTPRDAKEECAACRARVEHAEQVIPRRGSTLPRPKLEGYNRRAAVNRIPPSLIKHWATEAMAAIGLGE